MMILKNFCVIPFVKLSQKLLITPVALGILFPLFVKASEDSLSGFVNKDQLAITNSRIDTLETRLNKLEAASFSNITTLTGEASFQLGSVDEPVLTEAVTATYSYDLDLNTSFNGDDNLYVGIETGNGVFGLVDFVTDNSQGGNDTLNITSMYYSFPLGNYDLAVGPLLENDDLMPTTISQYSDKFFMAAQIGGLTAADFTSAPGIEGSGIAIGRTFDNGFNASASVIGMSADTPDGFLTSDGTDTYTLSAGYDGDNFGLGFIYTGIDEACSFFAGFQTCQTLGLNAIEATFVTLGAYWTPNNSKTSLSATYGILSPEVTGVDIDDLNSFHFGIDHEFGPGVLSAAIKSQDFILFDANGAAVVVGNRVPADSLGQYAEIYYTYYVNDSLEIRSGISFAIPDDEGVFFLDRTAVGAEATFKF